MLLTRVLRPSRALFSSLTSASRPKSCRSLALDPLLTRSSMAELAPYRQGYGTYSSKEPVEPLYTAQGARDFVYSLHSKERITLLQELQRFESMAAAQVFLHSAIPFIGFGFLDNAIMIVAGTQIELSIGVIFGISTMAAAALGNLVSDVAGLGLAGYVEALASRLGLPSPDLNPKQADMWQTRLSSQLGKVIGVTIGCLLGMFPLLFFKAEDEEMQQEPKN
ncbi:transmembrane protein 65 isoform X3 [Mobula hypostoma]|uniref:transmembrane protein 65 isoform X3 n=1 Tax=Mobula hypostoma TaxID=723540 RepID=UPI002FC29AA5